MYKNGFEVGKWTYYNDDGSIRKLDVKAGDRVLFGKFGGTDVKVDGEDLIILRESDILGIVENKKKTK